MTNLTVKRTIKKVTLAALICGSLSLMPIPAFSKSAEQTTPQSISEKSFAAMKAGKADEFAKLMVPSELERFKTSLLMIADMAKSKGQEAQIVGLFQTPDRKSLDELPPQEFLVRLMNKQFTPEMTELYSKATIKTLGVVKEGDELAHCVYVLNIPDMINKTSVVSLKKEGSTWGMLLTSDIDKMMQMLKLQFAQSGGELKINPELKSIKVLGSITDGDNTFVVIRSTTAVNGIDLDKVSPIEVRKTDPEYKLLGEADRAELEKSIKQKLGAYIDVARRAVELSKEAAAATSTEAAGEPSKKQEKQ
ncbi:MAG: hypothetical protein IT343_14085 [Candidatus Melainabacteria bacterium]|jgi:hypothetical protein|nr:hypothetical protein [Candidatus Melainabacteria bacterium]